MSDLILGESLAMLIDNRGKNPPFVPYGIPVASAKQVKDGKLNLENTRFVSPETYELWMPEKIRKNDVVLTSEAPLGRVALVRDDKPLALAQRLYGLRGKKGVLDSRFLFYALQTERVQGDLLSRSTGTTVHGIRQPELLKIRIPAPSYENQLTVAALLEALDDKIAVNDRVARMGLDLALARYSQLANSTQHWHSMPLRDTAKWASGGTPKTSETAYWGGRIPWISALSLKSPWIYSSDRNVTELGAENGTRIAPPNTVIFVVRGSSLDSEFRVGITQRDVAFGQDCKALLPTNGIDPSTLFVAMKANSSEILKLVDHAGHGAGRLSTDLIGAFEVRLPESDQIQQTSQILQPLVAMGAQKLQENLTLVTLRDALLPKLMSGEIRVREAEKVVEEVT